MTCSACQRAQSAPRIDDFEAGCESCVARAFAVTGNPVSPRWREITGAAFKDPDRGRELVDRWVTTVRQHDARSNA